MIEQPKIPDPETRKRSLERLRESNRQMELVTVALDELIAIIEADIRHQKMERLQGKYKRSSTKLEKHDV